MERIWIFMKITEDIIYAGVNDHQVDLFEGQYRVPNGMAYNSYVILDEKTAVMDTVDANFADEWLANVAKALDGRKPDYLIVQHMEPDHSANIENFVKAYPEATVVANTKTFAMMKNFFPKMDLAGRKLEVKDGESLTLGKHPSWNPPFAGNFRIIQFHLLFFLYDLQYVFSPEQFPPSGNRQAPQKTKFSIPDAVFFLSIAASPLPPDPAASDTFPLPAYSAAPLQLLNFMNDLFLLRHHFRVYLKRKRIFLPVLFTGKCHTRLYKFSLGI